jgi:hypothetical protein
MGNTRTIQALALVLLASCKQLSLGGSTTTSASTRGGATTSASPPSASNTSNGESVSADSSARAPSGSGHDKLGVLDVKIGMPLEVPGYTCTKDKRTASGDREDRHCVRFVDERCKGRPTNIGKKRYGEKAPMGCFHDTAGATYLDDVLMQDSHTGATDQARNGRVPLANVHLVGTESTPSKIYRIWYTVAWDDLSNESSKLHKALVQKYGEPRDIHSSKLRWKIDTTELVAHCSSDRACEIIVEDRKFEENVEDAQKEADLQQKRDAAPPPKL